MALYAIADLHLSFGTDKPMDVFSGWSNYTERIRQQWQRLVTPHDTVVIGGDISWAMKLTETEKDFRFLEELNGKKLLLKGNHDYWWSTKAKMDKYLEEKALGVYLCCIIIIMYVTALPCAVQEDGSMTLKRMQIC